MDITNLLKCELDLTSTPFHYATIITYELELTSSGKKIGLNLMDEDEFSIPYIIDMIMNSLSGNQLPTQAKKNVWIMNINVE